jgi:hypothetical protein
MNPALPLIILARMLPLKKSEQLANQILQQQRAQEAFETAKGRKSLAS